MEDSTMVSFKPFNMAAILSAAVVTQYLRSKLSSDATYRLFDNKRDGAAKPPEQEPAAPLLQAQSDRLPVPLRRRAF
jgi:hypothetical protein